MQLKLAHYVDIQWLEDNGFKLSNSGNDLYFLKCEEKKRISLLVYVDMGIREVYIGVDTYDILPPISQYLVRGEDITEVFDADKVRETMQFDLAFEFPKILYKMINEGAVHEIKEDLLNGIQD